MKPTSRPPYSKDTQHKIIQQKKIVLMRIHFGEDLAMASDAAVDIAFAHCCERHTPIEIEFDDWLLKRSPN